MADKHCDLLEGIRSYAKELCPGFIFNPRLIFLLF